MRKKVIGLLVVGVIIAAAMVVQSPVWAQTQDGEVLSFQDDYSPTNMCLDRETGCFEFWYMCEMGGYDFKTNDDGFDSCYLDDCLMVMNGQTQFWSFYDAGYYMYVTYDPINHTAWVFFFDYQTYDYATIWDSNTLDNDPCRLIDGDQRYPF